MYRLIRIFSVVLSVLSVMIFALIFIFNFFIPDKITVIDSNPYSDYNFLGIELLNFQSQKNVNLIQNEKSKEDKIQVNLLNIIPIKETVISNSKRQYVVLGGECFGIKMYTDGVVVVDIDDVETEFGAKSPAKSSGIKIGDVIKKVDNIYIKSNSHFSKLLQESKGREMEFEIIRDGKKQKVKFNTLKEKDSNKYCAGLWVRDSTAGLGTISFYNPENNSFAGLGHAVYDIDTNKCLPLKNGEFCPVTINGIYKSDKGNVGELCGVLGNKVLGSLCINCDVGVYGFTTCPNKEQIPVAIKSEIKTGKAQIVCSVDNTTKYYDVEITRIFAKSNDVNKDMIIKVVDGDLIEKTGGIVQGMSGSPIIQNGMLVGAVTHVFVNNPKQGYAILAEKMLETSTCQEMQKHEQLNKAS